MSKRWLLWVSGGVLAALIAWAGWRASIEIPDRLRGGEKEIADAAAQYGLDVRHGGLKFHLLHLFLSLDDLEVRDSATGAFLARAGNVEISLSPLRLLKGEIPVSRIRVRNFRVEAGEKNRVLYEKFSSSKGEGDGGRLPEILFVDGSVLLGPLGPVRRLEADVQELRIRQGRFFGTRIRISATRASGEISVPGEGAASWPFPSMEAELVAKGDVFKVRRARGWGGASTVRLSGFLEARERLLEGKASGEIDLAKWIARRHPGSAFVRHIVRSGKAEVSVSVAGPWNNPEGWGKVSLRDADIHGTALAAGEAALSVRGRIVRLDRARAGLFGGAVEASGRYEIDSGRAEARADMSRISLAAVPWADLGVPARLAGRADLGVSVSGTLERLQASVSLSLPDGVERLPAADRAGFAVRVPVSAHVVAGLSERGAVRLDSALFRAGRAEIRGEGEIDPPGRTVRLRGSAHAPSGKAAEYGFDYPLSWEGVDGDWEASGPFARLRTTVSLEISSLAAWSLPAVPVTVKVDGVPKDALHFVADVPAESFKLTAVGTATGVLDPERTRTGISVAAREIDLADAGKWVSAVFASLGKSPGDVREYLGGAKGSAQADGRVSIAPGSYDVSGTFRSRELAVRGIPMTAVKAEGNYGKEGDESRWTADGEGIFGDGIVRFGARSAPGGGAEASVEISGLRISQALALLPGKGVKSVEGIVDAKLEAVNGAMGWELPRVTAESKELAVGSARIADVRVEGSLGAASGRITVKAASPRVDLSGEVRRGGEWPANVALSLSELPTSFLLAAAGRPDVVSEGTWSARADGVVHLAGLAGEGPIIPGAFPALQGTVRATGAAVGMIRFGEFRTTGTRSGDVIAGEVVTVDPETRLSWELSLREPFGFRVEGPFSVGEDINGALRDDKRRVSVRGRTEIQGALRAVERTTGTIRIDSLTYREGGWELSGSGLTAAMSSDGIRWEGGTLTAAGAPVRISGKASWEGELDARIDGKLPAGVVRLAVPGVFDRLDGIAALELRVTGKLSDPTIVGAGRLEGGTLSFRGYAQQFDGLRAEAVLSREKIVFEHFEGRSGGGYIDGWGEVPLKVDGGQRMYFSVDFFDMRYPYPEEFRPVVQGHVELLGPVDDLLVTGDVEVQAARFTRNVYPEKALLDFRRRMSDVSARREKTDFRVRLDIDVVADRTIRIKNNIADASASGEFRVQGDTGKVIVLGSFDVYEGNVEFYGNKYELKRVSIDFQDPRRNNPRIDARAETRKGSYNIAVLVSGTLEKPEVDFTSDPPLGRTDIVSLLSFGVTTQTLLGTGVRPTDGTGSIGGAAIAIGSLGGVDEKIRGAVGLDKFSIETGFSQTTQSFEPRFVVRKSFEDRLSVSLSQSVGTTSETSASGEVRLLENVYLEGGWQSSTTSAPGQFSGDVKLRYRFQSLKELLNGGK